MSNEGKNIPQPFAPVKSTPGQKQAPDKDQKTPWTDRNASAFDERGLNNKDGKK